MTGVQTCALPIYGVQGKDTYTVNKNAGRVIEKASKRVDEVVLWSAFPNYLNFFKGRLFRNVPYQIHGHDKTKIRGKPYKHLGKIHADINRVVAIEDDRWFHPRKRVVRMYNGRNLLYALEEALEKL